MKLRRGILAKIRGSRKGQTMTEYSFIVLFIGLAAYSAFSGLGQGLKTFANNVVTFISAAVAAL